MRLQKQIRRRAGFTLVEILVVAVVVSTLLAFTMAGLRQASVVGNRTKCASNLRQIGAAIHVYASDHNGNLPPTSHSSGVDFESAWIFALAPYLDNVDEVRICPADPGGADRLAGGGTSYLLNDLVFDPKYGPFGELIGADNNLYRLNQPSKTFFAGIVAEKRKGASVQNDHVHGDAWDSDWNAFTNDIEANRHRLGESNADRTNGSANYLFGDGHVENIAATEMKRRIDNGENFARPPL